MFNLPGTRPKNNPHQVRQIKQWVAKLFCLADDVPVFVTELQCTEEGCPPLETVIAIMDVSGQTRQHKLHKPLAEVTFEDVSDLAQV